MELGGEVGYRVRFESRVAARDAVARRDRGHPHAPAPGRSRAWRTSALVVLDEFHERSLARRPRARAGRSACAAMPAPGPPRRGDVGDARRGADRRVLDALPARRRADRSLPERRLPVEVTLARALRRADRLEDASRAYASRATVRARCDGGDAAATCSSSCRASARSAARRGARAARAPRATSSSSSCTATCRPSAQDARARARPAPARDPRDQRRRDLADACRA